jgi:hypothetical protein
MMINKWAGRLGGATGIAASRSCGAHQIVLPGESRGPSFRRTSVSSLVIQTIA